MVNPAAARQQIAVRLKRLQSMSFAELNGLPAVNVQNVPFGVEQWSLTTYRYSENNRVRVVVQIGPPQPKLVLIHVLADGFRMDTDGTCTPLAERELIEFQ
jgi:hypothetical protein